MIKKAVAIILAVILSLSLSSCTDESPVFSHCELTIDLSDSFYEIENENFDVTYTDGESVVAILRISFEAAVNSGFSNLLNTREFGEYWLERCKRNADIVDGNTVWCEYYEVQGAYEQYYLEAFYRSKYAYFVVLFATAAENRDENIEKYLEYADSVNFI